MISEKIGADTQPTLSKPILKRFAINVASLFSVHIANYLLPLLTVPYVVRIIGPERLGMLNFSQAYVAYFTLLINYGFDMAAVRVVAANRNDEVLINKVFSEIITGKAILLFISSIIFCLISLTQTEFKTYLLLHISTYISCFGAVLFPVWLYQAKEDLGRVALFNLSIKILFTLSVFILINQPNDYIFYNLSISISQVIVSILALIVAIKRFNIKYNWPSFQNLRERFKQDSTLFYSSLTISLYSSSNIFLLGLLSSAYSVGIFSAGTRLENIARSFVGLALNQALFPIVAKAFGQSREEGLKIVRTVFFPLLVLMILISASLWLIAPSFITLFYGNKFEEAVSVLRIVSILPITIGISNLLGIHTMLNLRMDKSFFIITAFGSIIGLLLNFVMIQLYTYKGVAYAWVISEIYITVAMYIYLIHKGIQVINIKYIYKMVAFSRNKLSTILTK